MTQNPPAEHDGPQAAPTAPTPAPAPPAAPGTRGCLYALSQPPLMLFLAVIATLLAVTGFHDLIFL